MSIYYISGGISVAGINKGDCHEGKVREIIHNSLFPYEKNGDPYSVTWKYNDSGMIYFAEDYAFGYSLYKDLKDCCKRLRDIGVFVNGILRETGIINGGYRITAGEVEYLTEHEYQLAVTSEHELTNELSRKSEYIVANATSVEEAFEFFMAQYKDSEVCPGELFAQMTFPLLTGEQVIELKTLIDRNFDDSERKGLASKLLEADAERIGFECLGQDTFDSTVSYNEIGRSIQNVLQTFDDSKGLEIIENMLIAITGYGFKSTLENIEEHREYYDSL